MSLLLVGASPAIFTDYQIHQHDSYEVIMNTEGEGIAQIGEKEYPFSPGTIHVIPPATPHKKRAEKGFRDMYFNSDSPRLSSVFARSRLLPNEPLLLQDDASHTMEKILSVLLERYLITRSPEGIADGITDALYNILLQLIEEWSANPFDPVVQQLVHTITVSYNDPEFRVTEALTATGYTVDHIRRRFSQATGKTPNEYLKDVRLWHAKRLLRQKEKLQLPINEIALMCGFYDVAYFCRCFHKEVGMRPSAFADKKAAG